MMNDFFIIGAYWSSRPDSIENVGDKIVQILVQLSNIDEQFSNWYELGSSRKKALEKKVILNVETIKKICLKKIKRGEIDDNGFSDIGYSVQLWTGHKEEEACSISFYVGATFKTENLSNSCVLKLPYEGDAFNRLLLLNKAKTILNFFVEIFKPDYAVLTSQILRNYLDVANNIGWITYRKTVNSISQVSKEIIYEESDFAHWFYLKSEGKCYDYSLMKEFCTLKEIL